MEERIRQLESLGGDWRQSYPDVSFIQKLTGRCGVSLIVPAEVLGIRD